MGEWDVVGSAPLTASAPAAADPWAVVAHTPAPSTDIRDRVFQALGDFTRSTPGYGAADLATQGVSRLAGKIAAGGAGLVHGAVNLAGGDTQTTPADTVRSVESAPVFNYEAQSPGANAIRKVGSVIAAPFEAAAAPIDKAVANAGPAVSTFVPAASEAIQDVATVLPLGAIGRAAKAAEGASVVEGAAKPSVKAPLGTARSAGYEAPPSVVQASNPAEIVPGTTREKIIGPSGVRGDANVKNQTLTTRLAGEELGLKDAKKITAQDTENFRKTGPGPKYDTTAEKLGTIPADADAVGELQRIATVEDPASAVPAKTATNIDRIVNRIQSGQYSGTDWRRDISWLRENKGREAANALEDMAERHLTAKGDTETLDLYRSARADFAKSYDYQNAIGRGGQIDAQHLRDLDDKYPGMLTGNAKLIATAARELPEVTKLPGGDTGGGIHSKLQATHNAVGSVIKRIPGMNPMSERFQNSNFGREATPTEKSYVPSFGKRNPGGPLSERPQDPTGGLTLADDNGPITPPAPRGEGIPLSEVLSTGVERPVAPGLSLAPMGRPAPEGIPFTRDAGQMAGDLELAPEAVAAAPQNYSQLGQILSQGVPEGVTTRTPTRAAAPPRSDTLELEPQESLSMKLAPGRAYTAGQRELFGKDRGAVKKGKRNGDRK